MSNQQQVERLTQLWQNETFMNYVRRGSIQFRNWIVEGLSGRLNNEEMNSLMYIVENQVS